MTVAAATTYFFEGLLYMTRAAGITSHTTSMLFGGTATVDYGPTATMRRPEMMIVLSGSLAFAPSRSGWITVAPTMATLSSAPGAGLISAQAAVTASNAQRIRRPDCIGALVIRMIR